MSRFTDILFNLSPKKLAVYLVVGPLILFLVYTISITGFRWLSPSSSTGGTFFPVILVLIILFLATLVFLYLFWLRSVVYAVTRYNLGLPVRWFNLAQVLFVLYLLYNLCNSFFISHVPEDYRYLFHALNEFIAIGGLLIAYPLTCHYAARGITTKRTGEPATFINAVPFTLILIFGTVLGIPYFHKYFSTKTSTNSEIIIVYAFGFGLCVASFVIGFIAAITGLV